MSTDRLPRVQPIGTSADTPPGVVLVLHGGQSRSHGNPHSLRAAYLRMLPFARMLASGPNNPAVWLVRYRYRGWNAPRMDALRDTEWALQHAAARYPGVPAVLVGHSMGGRAALHATGHPSVIATCALAPWLDASDPVEPLVGRTVLIAHGDRDRMTDPAESLDYALRAKALTPRVCRFNVHGEGHSMLRRAKDWNSLVHRFVFGALEIEPEDPEIANALCQPVPTGLCAALSGVDR